MRKIILEEDTNTIPFGDVNQSRPIFAKKHGELVGMVVKEDAGWVLRTGGEFGATGHHETLRKCIQSCLIMIPMTFSHKCQAPSN